MNAKWCISTLLIILALLGLSQEKSKASNQQIVLQFTDVELASSTDHDQVLATITKKLHVLGVNSIEIVENDNTQLSIRYYSDIDALSVKEFLSQENDFPLDIPKEKLPEHYHLTVSDLQQKVDGQLYLNGKFAFVVKQESKPVSTPVFISTNPVFEPKQNTEVGVAYKLHRVVALSIQNTSQTIPEVRAGPYGCINS